MTEPVSSELRARHDLLIAQGALPSLAELAAALAQLVARGEMSATYARDVLLHVGYQRRGDEAGAVRAYGLCIGEATDLARKRNKAERAVCRAVWPLFMTNATKAEIEEAAGRANGGVLPWAELFHLLRKSMRTVAQVAHPYG